VTITLAEQDWTWLREASPYVALPVGKAPQFNPYPVVPAGSGVAASPLSALIGLMYDADNIYDVHFDILLGSWLQADSVPNIEPMAGELESLSRSPELIVLNHLSDPVKPIGRQNPCFHPTHFRPKRSA
jgi:hypothetical protein